MDISSGMNRVPNHEQYFGPIYNVIWMRAFYMGVTYPSISDA